MVSAQKPAIEGLGRQVNSWNHLTTSSFGTEGTRDLGVTHRDTQPDEVRGPGASLSLSSVQTEMTESSDNQDFGGSAALASFAANSSRPAPFCVSLMAWEIRE